MGLANGKPAQLREDRFAVDGTHLAERLGTTVSKLKGYLRGRDSELDSMPSSKTSVASLLAKVTVAEGVVLPVAVLLETVSFGDKYREVTDARVTALCKSFFQNGIQQDTGNPLHACLFLPEDKSTDATDPVRMPRAMCDSLYSSCGTGKGSFRLLQDISLQWHGAQLQSIDFR